MQEGKKCFYIKPTAVRKTTKNQIQAQKDDLILI